MTAPKVFEEVPIGPQPVRVDLGSGGWATVVADVPVQVGRATLCAGYPHKLRTDDLALDPVGRSVLARTKGRAGVLKVFRLTRQ